MTCSRVPLQQHCRHFMKLSNSSEWPDSFLISKCNLNQPNYVSHGSCLFLPHQKSLSANHDSSTYASSRLLLYFLLLILTAWNRICDWSWYQNRNNGFYCQCFRKLVIFCLISYFWLLVHACFFPKLLFIVVTAF